MRRKGRPWSEYRSLHALLTGEDRGTEAPLEGTALPSGRSARGAGRGTRGDQVAWLLGLGSLHARALRVQRGRLPAPTSPRAFVGLLAAAQPLWAAGGGGGPRSRRRAGCLLQNSPPTSRSPAPGRDRAGRGRPVRGREARGRRPGLLPAGAPARGTSRSAPQPRPASLAASPAPQLRRLRVGARPHARSFPAPGVLSRAARPHPEPVHSASVAARLPPFPGVCGAGAPEERRLRGREGDTPPARGRPRASSLRARRPPRSVPRAQPAATAVPGRRGQARPAPGRGGPAPGPGCGGARGGTALNALDSPAPARPASPLTAGGFVFSSHSARPAPPRAHVTRRRRRRQVRPREPGPRRLHPFPGVRGADRSRRGCGAVGGCARARTLGVG